ncbi:MAG: hypothetical protein R6X02_28680 [Enhygromyxa sp.]
MRPSIVLASLLACVACKSEDPPAERRAAPSPEQQPETSEKSEKSEKSAKPGKPEISVAMTEHFVHASALEQAVIDGDLEAVQTHAKWLVSELSPERLPSTWQPSLERMQAAAREASKAEDLATAASAAGKVIETCGACHAAVGGGPKFAPASPVPEGESSQARMQRHQWAAERMREGMIGPSDERWRLGASAVSVAPPEPCPIESAEILAEDVLALREKIYEVGAQALETKPGEERARVYGEYLSTCAGCHVGGC